MRYEDWTFREAEVRLSEHRELRRTLELASVTDYTTVYRCLRLSHVKTSCTREMNGLKTSLRRLVSIRFWT